MDRKCSWKRTEEVEIDLLDLLRRLGRQWRRVAVCALSFAVLAGAGSYFVSKNAGADAAEADTAQLGAAAEPGPAPLTAQEQERGVAAAWQLAKETAQLERYMEHSVLMRIDPYHKNTVQLVFQIEGADVWATQKIVEKYLDYLANDGAVDDICKIDPEMEQVNSKGSAADTENTEDTENAGGIEGTEGTGSAGDIEGTEGTGSAGDIESTKSTGSAGGTGSSFLPELFQAAQKTSSTYTDREENTYGGVLLSVDVTGKDSGMAQKLAADIQAVLETYSSIVKKECGGHTFALLGSGEKERADRDLLAWQRDRRASLATDQANLKAMVDAFDGTQKALYAAMEASAAQPDMHGTDGKPESNGAGTGTEPGSSAAGTGTEPGSKDADADLESESGDAGAQQPDGESEGSISALSVLLGFLGGIFAYCAVYAGWYLLRDTVKSAGEFRSYYTFPFYGSILLPDREGKAERGGKSSIRQDAYEGQKARMLNRIRLSCKKHGVSRLFLAADFPLDGKEKECMESIARQLREWGLDVSSAGNISGNIAMWDALTQAGTVLMVCRLGHTTHRMVDDAMEFYQENGVAVLGAVALE